MNAYTFHITPYDLAFVGTIFIGLTLAVLLWFTKRLNRTANRFLALALLAIVLWMIWVLCIDIRLGTYFPRWSWLPLQFSLALGPLIYFYALKVTRSQHKFRWKDLLHFGPLLLQQFVLIFGIRESSITGAATYDTLIFQQWNPVVQLLALISVITYLYLSFRLIESFYRGLKFDSAGDRYRDELRWLHRLLAGFCLLLVLWIPYAALDYFYHHHQSGMHAYYPFYLLLAIMMIRMAAAAFIKPENAVASEEPVVAKLPVPAELKQKSVWLKRAMEAHLFYQDAELTLSSLAEKIGIHPHELSRIINTAIGKNFNDFVNEYRIREVTRKMRDPAYDRLTLIGIALDAGFNSKSTFNRTFRQMTGRTPAEFKSELKNERPTYHLTPYSNPAAIISFREATPMWSSGKLNRSYMFKNYFKIAWRNLVRQRLYSLINISGLAIGLAVCMTIMLYVAHEHSYDSFHRNTDRLVSIRTEQMHDGHSIINPRVSFATGQMLKQSIPAVEAYTNFFRYFPFLPVVVNRPSSPTIKFSEGNLLFADPGFFNFFSFKLITGNPANVLTRPYSVVISRDIAQKYFGDENPVGKTLTIKTENTYTYQVTGVAENNPSNSSINFDFVASVNTLRNYKGMFPYLGDQQIGPGFFNTYLLLKHPADTARVAQTLNRMTKKGPFGKMTFSLPLFTDYHLKDNAGNVSSTKYLTIFPLVALLILLLALVNYMSLSTARSTLRAKEVAVRKISGASRKSLAMQFYVESAVYASLSFALGYLLCCAFKPLFLNALQLNIDNSFLFSPTVLLLSGALFIITVLVAGSYPSLVLSAFKPAVTMKGKMSKQTGGVAVRKVFTIFQFAIATALIICGIVIDRQLYFFRHTDTGMNRENVVMVPVPGYFTNKYQPFESDVKALAGVAELGTSNYSMFTMYDSYNIQGKTPDDLTDLFAETVDKNFISTLNMQWKIAPAKGADLSSPDITKVIINEAAISQLHLAPNPVGSYLESARPKTKLQIVGVLKNFNFRSMEVAIKPFALRVAPDNFIWHEPGCAMYVKVKPHTNLPSLIDKMRHIYQKYDVETPFSYSFVDDAFNEQYMAEDRLASIFSIFTIVTIVLATMGLFGLAAFTIEQRTKEIGIRKVLGASIASINSLLSKDFLKLVLLSIIVASPVAWWFMHNWLQGFTYRISIQWWMFAGAGLLAIIVAAITVSYHAVRTAMANPVESLRSE